MRLGVRVGEGCAHLHNRMMRGLQVPILEFDEIWGYVGKKQRRTTPSETDKGDQYTYTALDATRKAIVSYMTGKRNETTTREAARLVGLPDDYEFPRSWTESMRQLGNAVPAPLGAAAGRWLAAQIGGARPLVGLASTRRAA